MTAPHLKTAEIIAVMQAFAEGKEIEIRRKGGGFVFVATDGPTWNWDECDYRVAPEPAAPREAREWSIAVRPSGDVDDWFPVLGNDENWWRKNGHEIVRVREVLPDPYGPLSKVEQWAKDNPDVVSRLVRKHLYGEDDSPVEAVEPPSGKLPEWRYFSCTISPVNWRFHDENSIGEWRLPGGPWNKGSYSEREIRVTSSKLFVETDAHGTPLGREGA